MDNNKQKQVPTREEVLSQDTWRLEDIFTTDAAWEEEFTAVQRLIPTILEMKGKLSLSASHLLQCLEMYNGIMMRMEKVYTYAHMRFDQDTANTFYQGLNDRANSLFTDAVKTASFIVPEILTIQSETLHSFLEQNSGLQLYRHDLEKVINRREHILSDSEESLLAGAAEVMRSSANTFSLLNNADLVFPSITDEHGNRIEVTHGRYAVILESRDQRVRRDAFKSVYSVYGQFRNTFASTLGSTIKKNNYVAGVRNYSSARDASMSSNNIPEIVYDQLITAIHKHLPLFHRYLALKKRMLATDEFHIYDLFAPVGPAVNFPVTYAEAQQLTIEACRPLGEEYVSILQQAFQNRWIDVYENKGKRSGAYSSGCYGTNPYILMNWQDNVNNLFTLAHELGHSVHSYYTRSTQPYVYGDYPIFVAEVASTCNEALLNHYLLSVTTEPSKKLNLLVHYLDTFRGTVFRQTMFAEFEQLVHRQAQAGEALTAAFLNETYYKLNQTYFGTNITLDEEVSLEWARIPHFYYNFYVYQYATGFSAATTLSDQILHEGAPAVARYIQFLKSGSSNYPIEALKAAGVDMTTTTPIERAMQVFGQLVTTTEQLFNSVQ